MATETAAAPAPTSSTANGKRQTQGPKVCRFIERHCIHTNGKWVGKPFKLLPWQRRLIYELFEVHDNGVRRYRWALIGLPKKNGKTELAAALALYFLIADGEPAPFIPVAAASEGQADLVFGAAKKMCELSPTLSSLTEVYESEILVPSIPGASLKRVAAAAGTNDGPNVFVVIADELHEWTGTKGKNVWNVLTNGTGAREQPMVIQITTAGFDLDGTICGEQYQYGCKVRDGEIDDPQFYFFWVEAPAESDYRDPAVWEAANPSYGVLVHEAFFRDQLGKKTEATFRRYFLNQWVAGETLWLPQGAWDACYAPELELDPALPANVGIDVSNRHDATAVTVVQKQGERLVMRLRTWSNPYPEGHELHESWRVNNEWIKEHLRALFAEFPVPACQIDGQVKRGPAFYYDPWNFREAADELTREGLAMVEYNQTHARMVPASQALFEVIVKGRAAHDGDPVFKRHIANVTPDQTPRGARISKPKGSRRHIDGAVAAAIATWATQEAPPPAPRRSAYEDRGLVVV
jgi:phage terminase large subunit-like protein